ncbi:glycoside hydrolase family 55 protein [bacterium]|nr:glycoside hydrolase family 55 protein [bacterium]
MNGAWQKTFLVLFVIVMQTSIFCASSFCEPEASPLEGIFSVKDFGAHADGQNDDTAAIQQCIDAAAEKGGQVYLPPGKYLVKGSLNVKTGVAVKGAHEAPLAIEPLIGSIIMATGGRDNEKAPALFEMGHSSTVKGLTIWYPEQKPTDIHPYPWTFHLTGFDNTVENITLINSYNGICVGPEGNVRHRIRSVYGCVLRRGLFVDGCTDIGRVENVQFHCHWWSAKSIGGDWDPVYKYMYENCEAFVFGRTDWEYVTNNFVFPAKIGFRFIRTEHGACNGQFTGNGADACETAVLVEEIQPMGLLITGGQFVAFNGENPIELVVAKSCTGSVRLVNCAFWGPSNHNALLEGNGFVSFNDCYFSNSKKETENMPLIVAKQGRLQINNSSFATAQPGVELGPELKHAIIQGNNGVNGVRVINHAKRAIIENNE